MAQMICPEIVDERGQSSEKPCQFYCGPKDFDAWRYKARQRIAQALLRTDLDGETRSKLSGWQRQIEQMPKPLLESGAAVQTFVAMARQAECIALAPKLEDLPPLLDPHSAPWWQRKEVVIALLLLAGGVYWAHQSGNLKKWMRPK
jgi:hypothetical protein